MKIKFTPHHIKFLLVLVGILLLTAVASSTFASKFNKYQPEPDLLALVLQPSDFPEDAESYISGAFTPNDISQPLNSESLWVKSQPVFSEYISGYSSEGIIPSGTGVVMAGSYVYQYPSADQAKEAETIIIATLFNEGGVMADTTVSATDTAVPYHTFFLSYPEIASRSTYWLVTTKENVLIMMVVDGLSEPDTAIRETFNEYVNKLLQ